MVNASSNSDSSFAAEVFQFFPLISIGDFQLVFSSFSQVMGKSSSTLVSWRAQNLYPALGWRHRSHHGWSVRPHEVAREGPFMKSTRTDGVNTLEGKRPS